MHHLPILLLMLVFCAAVQPVLVFAAEQTTRPSEENAKDSRVSYADLIREIKTYASTLEESDVLRAEFRQLQSTHGLADTEAVFKEFVRVRLAFELTRDSGLWQIRWAVTNKEPNSDNIWAQWKAYSMESFLPGRVLPLPTAVAECDEISALFAFVARELGVKKVGLFWPTHNHTVAVWTAKAASGDEARVVVPTTQIFLDENAGLGTQGFDPYKQTTIYTYQRKEVSADTLLPLSLAQLMIGQMKAFAHLPAGELQQQRNLLSNRMGGS